MATPLTVGAPGIYLHPETAPPSLGGVRMDVCAFIGVAPRGPVRVPLLDETWRFDRPCVGPGIRQRRSVAVAVESFDEYRRLFGGFEGPGRLPYAVSAFFEQGGRRAYVVRIVHDYGDATNSDGAAKGRLGGATPTAGDLLLVARNEGSWGNRMRASLGYSVTPLGFETPSVTDLTLDEREPVLLGSLLRLTLPGGERVLRFVAGIRKEGRDDGSGAILRVTLDQPLPDPREQEEAVDQAELVEGILAIDDGSGNSERHEGLGLSSTHCRWMATVLCYESELVYPHASWADGDVVPDDPAALPAEPVLDDSDQPQFGGGEDRYAEIVHEDFFDASWTLGDPEPGDGVHALTHLPDLSSVVAPDLYSPEPLPPDGTPFDPASLGSACFELCLERGPAAEDEEIAPADLHCLHLDPAVPEELDQIVALQQRLVDLAERLRSFVVLLDVPPGLPHREILRWRSRFRSSYAAAYHPWLKIAPLNDRRDTLILINPSAVAAGIIARQELAFGVPHGPANVLAAGVVDVEQAVSPSRHDELHPLGINVYLRERDGVRLSAGRTLSRDPRYRQLTVRRLMLMLRRVLEQQTHWMVFEPNGPSLRADVRHMLRNYLRQLYRTGAFTGATEEEAFFVRCDEGLNPPRVIDAGQLVVEVGVAPSEPIEFIVLRITRGGDGTLSVEG